MISKSVPLFYILSLILLLSGCAGSPETPAAAAPAAAASEEKPPAEEKPEIIKYKVPVLLRETRFFGSGSLDMYTEHAYVPGTERLVSSVTYDLSGNVFETAKADYKDNSVTILYHDRNNALLKIKTEKFDNSNNIIESVLHDNAGKQISRSVYEYDTAGNRVKWEIYDSSNALLAYNVYIYENSLNTRTDSFSPAGVLEEYFETEFDLEGNRKSARNYTSAGRLIGKTDFTYKNSRITSEKRYRGENTLMGIIEYSHKETEDRFTETAVFINPNRNIIETIEKEYFFIEKEMIGDKRK